MNRLYTADVFLNIIVPLLAGICIYLLPLQHIFLIRNYLPDALWAYAFAAVILIVWERQMNLPWLTVLFITAAAFEWTQYADLIAGTGDWIDVLVYFISFGIAIFFNPYFKSKFQNKQL